MNLNKNDKILFEYFTHKSSFKVVFMDKKVFNRIKAVLAEKGKTNEWLAKQLSISTNTVSKWCTNSMQPTIERLFAVASELDVDVRELLVSNKQK